MVGQVRRILKVNHQVPALRREVGCCDCSSLFCGAGLECLSVGGLAELADELQRCVHEYSEELVSELARRDELDFEKELKNQFIWLLLRVQRRRRHLQQIETRAAVTGLHRTSAANTEVRPTTATAGVAAAELNVPRHSAPPHVVTRVTTHTHTPV